MSTVANPLSVAAADVVEWRVVDDRPEPEPIEIELTSNSVDADRHHRWRAAEPVPFVVGQAAVLEPPVESQQDRPVQPGVDQRRLLITATIVGVVALLLGWVVGRSGASDDVATTSDIGTEAPTVTTAPIRAPLLSGEALPTPEPAPTSSGPRRTTTTTTLSPPTLETVELDPRLAGIELSLVGVEQGDFVELDLATQTLARRDLGRVGPELASMIVGDDWVVLSNQSGTTSLFREDGRSERVDLGDAWQLLWQPGTDRFWRPASADGWRPQSVYDEIDLTGASTGTRLELPANTWPSQVDPSGGLIVVAVGKTYSVKKSSTEFIGTGELLGLSTDFAVVRDCDEQLRCGLFVIDRTTGSVREVGDDQGDQEIVSSLWGWGGAAGSSISPDGTSCVVVVIDDVGPVMGLLDLSTGAFVPLGQGVNNPYVNNPSVVWSSDGRFVFFLQGYNGINVPGLWAYDRQTDEAFAVMTKPASEWSALSVRPTS